MASEQEQLHLLREIVRVSERTIDHQVLAAQRLNEKAEQMIRLGVVTLGGAVTLGTFIGQAPEFEATLASASVFSLGIVLNLGALSRFVDVYAGFRFQSELFSAPDLGQIVAKVSHERWTLARFLRALSAGYSDYSEYNAEKMVRSAKGRARGLHLLLVSVACYGTSISLILMGAL